MLPFCVRNGLYKKNLTWLDFTCFLDLPGKTPLGGGWGTSQWESALEEEEEEEPTSPLSSEAITTPVTRTVDETDNFFSAFLPAQDVTNTQIVSSAPQTKRREQEKAKKSKEPVILNEVESFESEFSHLALDDVNVSGSLPDEPEALSGVPEEHSSVLQPAILVASQEDPPFDSITGTCTINDRRVENEVALESVDNPTEQQLIHLEPLTGDPDLTDSHGASDEPESISPSTSSPSTPPKPIQLETKDGKVEDRQTDTPSPPVSAFSSGTSTTSDIEVLDHESVLSESSASSRQETAEVKAGLHLMQGSFQLLSASACGEFPRLEDYAKLTESCGSSSDAFERIDSFSMQSLDSRSVSEVNSDDEIPGSRTLASVTAGSEPIAPTSSVVFQSQDEAPREEQEGKVGKEEVEEQHQEEEDEDEEEEEGLTETMRDQSLDEMEESGRSATPVNCEQPEDLTEEDEHAGLMMSSTTSELEENPTQPITKEMRSVSTCQILELQKVISIDHTLKLMMPDHHAFKAKLLHSHIDLTPLTISEYKPEVIVLLCRHLPMFCFYLTHISCQANRQYFIWQTFQCCSQAQ